MKETRSIILYSTDCPRCHVLEQKLNRLGIIFTKNTDVDEMISLGIVSVPVLRVSNKLYNFKEANDLLNQYAKGEINYIS